MKRAHKLVLCRTLSAALGLATPALAATHPLGWGLNGDYQAAPVPTNVMDDATAISAGYVHSLAIKEGRVWTWGSAANGLTNVPASALSGVTQAVGGGVFSLALRTNGAVVAWGSGAVVTGLPATVTSGVTQIAAGESHALALKAGGIIAWGSNTYNQCVVPGHLTNDVDAIGAGRYYSLGLKDGAVTVFGIAATNVNPDAYGIRDVPPEALAGVEAIAAGQWHALALKAGGVIAWGASFFDATNVPVEAQSDVTAIAAGDCFSIALKSDGTLVVWGDDTKGQLPIPNYASNGVSQIAAGAGHCLAICSGMPPRFVDARTPDGYLGLPYTNNAYVLAAGDPAVTYHKTVGWPAWLTLDANTGVLGGTPLALGTYYFSVVASNSIGRATNDARVIVLDKPPEKPVFLTTNLPNGTVGAAYAQQIVITNGGTFRIIEGGLPAGLTLNTNDGWIAGTPTTPGSPQFRVVASNAAGTATNLFTLAIDPPAGAPIFTTGSPLPGGVVGEPYQFQIGTENYPTNFGLVSGAFPLGLGVTETGLVTGTPVQVETAEFTVFATNMLGGAETNYSLHISGPPVFTSTNLVAGTVGDPYSAQLETDTGESFSLVAGGLHSGLGLTAGGMITGTPTVAGTSNFTVRAGNGYGETDQPFALTVNEAAGPPVFTTPSPLPGGVVGVAYATSIQASGSPTYSLAGGSLPPGLNLGAAGLLDGLPNDAGDYSFTVRATNAYGWAERLFELEILGPPEFITASPLPGGVVGVFYSQAIEASGSPTYSLFAGSLPDGLTLDGAGLASGTPTNAGAFNFTVRATNAYGWSNRVFDLSILSQSPPRIVFFRKTNAVVRLEWVTSNLADKVQVDMATNIVRNPVTWSNLGEQTSPWTNAVPTNTTYFRLRLAP